ncbi:MAG: tetratricopeptide repeat protein [Actinobacteria bacterium]|nr:tetratricopeptide repeat protein [Actinomycetota bacterium]MBV9253092.1 tetratricopeptide repeat protein [Actinomycetota bacterium]
MTCPSCGAGVPDRARFCPSCGHPLHARADERRIVTVLFGDLVGFTTMSETRDPESVKNIVDQCFERLAADITAFGGRVDKIIGDAIVALFGAPVAHEDDGERAVRAALQMQRTIAGMATQVGVDVRLRIGVNTGEVLVGALRAGGDYTAMGDVVNVASRLQTLAAPGQILVGPDTHDCTHAVMHYEHLGAVPVKGREEPVEAWVAIEALAPPGRRPRRSPTPLVGRDHELGLLSHSLATATARRRPQLVLLLGEAGIGKSRLAEEAASMAACDYDASVLEGRCVPYGEANAWWPVAEALRQACDIKPDDPADVWRAKTRTTAEETTGLTGTELDRIVESLQHLMGDEDALAELDPVRARDEARRALHILIEGIARSRPLVIVLSELHWADDLVLDLVDDMFDRSRGLPVVLVATARPELEERWAPKPGRHNAVVLHVDPLDDTAADELLTSLLGTAPPPDLRALLLERSGGNPFFLEELVALLNEAGVLHQKGQPAGEAAGDLPATLRGLVAARLDSLSSRERGVLEDAAVGGRTGRLDALVAMAESRGDTDVARILVDLATKDLLIVDEGAWSFRSEVVREVAYETLTKAARARRHAALADWLVERTRGLGREDEELEQIAHHYGVAAELVRELGGSIEGVPVDILGQALKSIERAAVRAHERDMHPVSLRLLDQAMRLLPPDSEHKPRVLHARAKAQAGLHRLAEAQEDLADLLAIAEAKNDKGWEAAALTVLGDVQQRAGEPEASIATLERAVALWSELDNAAGKAEALGNLGFTLLQNDDPSRAEGPFTEALELARSTGDRRATAWAQQRLAWISFYRGDTSAAEERLEKAAATFREIGDNGGLAWANGLMAWVRFFQGRHDEAGALADSIIGEAKNMGDKWAFAMVLVLQASVRLLTGRPLEAVEPARNARTLFEQIDDTGGQAQAIALVSRALIASGAVEEGLESLVEYAEPAAKVTSTKGRGSGFVGMAEASIFNQIGDPERAAAAIGMHGPGAPEDSIGHAEREAVLGIIRLQQGEVPAALQALRVAEQTAHTDGERANINGALSLALVASGNPSDALDVSAKVDDPNTGTYLDHTIATIGAGFAFFQLAQRPEGERAFARALATVDGTTDRLSQAVVRLAYGRALEGIGAEESAEVLEDARHRLDALGIEAGGWDTAFTLAARAGAARPTPATSDTN